MCAPDDIMMTNSDEVSQCMCWTQVVDSRYAPTLKDYVAVDATLAVGGELTKENIVSTAGTHDGAQDNEQEENIMEEDRSAKPN